MKTDMLRAYINLVLEKARAPEHVEGEGLACTTFIPVPGIMTVILYDPNGVYNTIVDKVNTQIAAGRPVQIRSLVLAIGRAKASFATKHIYAGITIEQLSRCNKAWQIGLVYAKQGWGPLIYDIAMSKVQEGLIPSRSSISDAAHKIWNYYMLQRDDVTKVPIPDSCKRYKREDQKAFNLIYKSTRQPPDLRGAEARHTELVKRIVSLNELSDGKRRLTPRDVEEALSTTFRGSFHYR